MNEESLLRLLKATSVVGAGLFTGGAIGVSFVDVRTRKSLGTTHSINHFQAEVYKLVAQQASLAIVSGVSGLWAGKVLIESDPKHAKQFIAGGLIILSVLPYIAVFMGSNMRYLLDPKVDKASQETADELDKWGKLHLARTIAGCLAVAVFAKAAFY